jgi:hypothetical protein
MTDEELLAMWNSIHNQAIDKRMDKILAASGVGVPTKTTKDPRQIDLEDWLMQDEYTTPAPEETKNALHGVLEGATT